MSLMYEMNQKALELGVPISVHLDVTYRCNERCVHCYLDHDDHGEMTTAEIKGVLEQLADAGVFFLTFSGGEVFMRRDFLELVEYARQLQFNVKVKTNAVMIREHEAQRLRALGVEQIQISVYSHRPEIHDAITKLPGSLKRTIKAIRFLKSQGLKVTIANVLMIKFLEMGGRPVTLLDGDLVRKHLSSELGFSKEHRDINIRRIGYVASEITKNGGIAICAPIAPYDATRKDVRTMIEPFGGFILIHLSTSLDVCEERDRKGLYAKARAGILKEFTGISDPYEQPTDAEVTIDTGELSPEEAAQEIILHLEREDFVGINGEVPDSMST